MEKLEHMHHQCTTWHFINCFVDVDEGWGKMSVKFMLSLH